MKVFVTGGTGQVGPTVVSELVAAGHQVTGLARSEASAAVLTSLGAVPWPGAVEDLDALAAGAAGSDGVVHLAFGGDFADPDSLVRRDRAAIEALGTALVGSDRPFVVTSGTLVMTPGRVATERDDPDPRSIAWFRIPGEHTALAFADRGVRVSVVRLAPTVHGPGDHGFVPALVAAARRSGVSAYVEDGANRWPAVHRRDAAALFRAALEEAPPGSVLHGVGETAVRIGDLAAVVADTLGVPTVSTTPDAFATHLGNPFLARFFALDVPVSSALTQSLLGWAPHHPTLLDDVRAGDYTTPEAFARAEAIWFTPSP